MLFNGRFETRRITGSLKPASLTVMIDDVESLTYDRAGRLWSRWLGGRTYRRGLDGRVLEKWSHGGRRHRRRLQPQQTAGLLDESAARMRALSEALAQGRIAWTLRPEDADDLARVAAKAGKFDAAAGERDRWRFSQVYGPIGILPPDQYLSLVLQATTGCSFNACAFCDFYAAQRFHIKSELAFRDHARAVREFMGESIGMRRSIFLGEANALAIPFARLQLLMAAARDEVGGWPVHAFLDAFSGVKKSADEYRQLAALGLKRVSIGLESGHDPLLAFVRKPGAARDAVATVERLKSAGVAVSVIVLLGLGGDRYAEPHAADTAAALNAMPLGKGDIIYFSELVEHAATPYPALARAAKLRPLTPEETSAQRRAIRSSLRFGPGGPTVSRYDIREFVY